MQSSVFDKLIAEQLCQQSRESPRRRAHYCMHDADCAPVHRIVVAMQMDSYVPPHRHLDANKQETLLILRGSLGFIEFDNTGNIVAHRLISPERGVWCIDIPTGCWHAVVALEPDTLFFETKAGPYKPLSDEERALWAPQEHDKAAPATLRNLHALFSA